jgi:hypothetical protein
MKATIDGLDPNSVNKVRIDSQMAERSRIEMLKAMRLPGLETIIDQAIQEGHDPNEVALVCCKALKAKQESDNWIASFKRESQAAAKVPACDAPFAEPKPDSEKTEANKAIVGGFRKLKYQ